MQRVCVCKHPVGVEFSNIFIFFLLDWNSFEFPFSLQHRKWLLSMSMDRRWSINIMKWIQLFSWCALYDTFQWQRPWFIGYMAAECWTLIWLVVALGKFISCTFARFAFIRNSKELSPLGCVWVCVCVCLLYPNSNRIMVIVCVCVCNRDSDGAPWCERTNTTLIPVPHLLSLWNLNCKLCHRFRRIVTKHNAWRARYVRFWWCEQQKTIIRLFAFLWDTGLRQKDEVNLNSLVILNI